MGKLQITCSKADAFGKRRIEVTDDHFNYTDNFDPTDAYRRKKFGEAVCLNYGWENCTDNVEMIAAGLQRALAAAERQESTMRSLRLEAASSIVPTELRWLWQDKLPLGKVVMLAGDPGLGKSVLTIALAAAVTRGKSIVEGEVANEGSPGNVIFFSAEDDPNDTMVPRLLAADADLERVFFGTSMIERTGKREDTSTIDLFADLPQIEEAVQKIGEASLLIIDPVTAYLGNVGENSNSEVRKLLHPLSHLASAHNLTILCVTHLRKQKGKSLYRFIGSVGFVAAARCAWLVRRVGESGNRRCLQPIKSNVATAEGSLLFSVVSSDLNACPVIQWEGYANGEASDLPLAPGSERGRPPTKIREALDLLVALATEHGREVPVALVGTQGRLQNISERTLRRALKHCGWEYINRETDAPYYLVPPNNEDGNRAR